LRGSKDAATGASGPSFEARRKCDEHLSMTVVVWRARTPPQGSFDIQRHRQPATQRASAASIIYP
jgi:hypothetical protein